MAKMFQGGTWQFTRIKPALGSADHRLRSFYEAWEFDRLISSSKVYCFPGNNSRLKVGPFCSIAHEVEIFLGGNHPVDWVSTFPFRARFGMPGAFEDGTPATRGDVVVGPDVWLAHGVTVLSGVSIGPGAVAAAGAVVTRDVAPYEIVAGQADP